MHNVYPRVISWNEKRYPQEYSHQLTLALLREEYREWLEALSEVDKLDALCDLLYVSLGAIWKFNGTQEQNEEGESRAHSLAHQLVELTNEPNQAYFVGYQIDVLEFEKDYPVLVGLHLIIKFSLLQMLAMGLSYDQCIEAMLVVCDSNDSKSIKKTDPNVKANAGDKGAFFVAPEPRLQQILDKREVTL